MTKLAAATATLGNEADHEWTVEKVKEYYGKVLKTNKDLKSTACCSSATPPAHLRAILECIHPEISERFYGCGAPLPHALEGATVLDLGCGTGRDCYVLSRLVGPNGRVIGVDMTDEQLAVARKHLDYHAKQFGYARSNVEFIKGYMEELEDIGIASESIDLVVSNCVFNLSPRKEMLFREIFRVLKPGGELYFSDVFADRRLPTQVQNDPLLLGECLGGALYIEDFRRLLRDCGVLDYRRMSTSPIYITHPEISRKVGEARFDSITVRAFKLPLEDLCEDFGQAAEYLGTIPECPHTFMLDDHHLFEKGRLVSVCGNTAAMVQQTRFGKHFRIHGEGSVHYGLFPCGPSGTVTSNASGGGSCC